jgi:protein involved in polysaccharide export with SLBB domain
VWESDGGVSPVSAVVPVVPHCCECLIFSGFPSLMRNGVVVSVLLATALGTPSGLLSAQAGVGAARSAGDSGAVVRPGDIIRLKIWREPDMSGDIAVDEGGIATLPRLGPLSVANLPADSLKRRLINAYAKYLRDPAVEITVLPRITVLGAVRTPNVYHVEPTMTVADALALAGGASPDGKVDQVELRRRDQGSILKVSRGTRLADTPIRSGDELYVPQRSWLSRNSGLVIGGVSTAISILYFVFR